MTLDEANRIADWINEYGIECEARQYSGRAMYGKSTGAIVLNGGDGPLIGYAAARVGVPPESLPSRTDSMGHDTVFY